MVIATVNRRLCYDLRIGAEYYKYIGRQRLSHSLHQSLVHRTLSCQRGGKGAGGLGQTLAEGFATLFAVGYVGVALEL